MYSKENKRILRDRWETIKHITLNMHCYPRERRKEEGKEEGRKRGGKEGRKEGREGGRKGGVKKRHLMAESSNLRKSINMCI